MNKTFILNLALVLTFWGTATLFSGTIFANTVSIYVAPRGTGNGTKLKPFGSLEKAKDKVISLRKGGQKGNIDVILMNGVYYLPKTLILGRDVGAPSGATTRFVAAPGAKPLISGGKVISGWKQYKDNIWMAKVPWAKGKAFFHCLYDGEKLLPRAISTEQFSVKNEATSYCGTLKQRYEFSFEPGTFKKWDNMQDIELYGGQKRWVKTYLPIAELDLENGKGRWAIPATYSMGGRYYIENCLEYLDQPGEWVLNSQKGILYYKPKSGTPGKNIIAPMLDELVRVEGVTDTSLKGEREKPAEGIAFEGIYFSHADRQKWELTDKGIQHDWTMWDKESGLLRFRSARNCSVTSCYFQDSGSDAVRLDLYCQNISVQNSYITRMGGVGIVLCGYGPGKKDVNRNNRISDNHITQIGTLFAHSCGIFVWQSGHNQIVNNHIEDLPYMGIVISGVRRRFFAKEFERRGLKNRYTRWLFPDGTRELIGTIRWDEIHLKDAEDWKAFEPYMHSRNNLIAYNEINDCMKVLGDGNAIYTSSQGYGNVIKYNVVYDLLQGSSIRTDDDSHYVTLTGNLVFGTHNPKGISLKGLNIATNNIFINCYMEGGGAGNKVDPNATIARNILYWLDNLKPEYNFQDSRLKIVGKGLDYNVYYCKDLALAKRKLQELLAQNKTKQADHNSITADPMFVDITAGNFDLKRKSPALKLGIKPLTPDIVAKMGCLDDPFIKRWDPNKFLRTDHPERRKK